MFIVVLFSGVDSLSFLRCMILLQLERWVEVVKDYKALKRELPNDNEVAESLRQAQLALEKSRQMVYGTKFGVEVEQICALDKFKAALASAGNYLNMLTQHFSCFIHTFFK